MLNAATEKQDWIAFALLSRYKIYRLIRTAVNNANVLRASCTVEENAVRF
jgi:hypothetical protein